MTTKALPEQYRLARNIQRGYEIRATDGTWLGVVNAFHLLAPIKVSSFDLSDGSKANADQRDSIMSRRPASDEDGAR